MTAPRIPVPDHLLTVYGSPDAYAAYDPSIKTWRLALARAGASAGALDAVTTDLVRLRNAFLQGCNT